MLNIHHSSDRKLSLHIWILCGDGGRIICESIPAAPRNALHFPDREIRPTSAHCWMSITLPQFNSSLRSGADLVLVELTTGWLPFGNLASADRPQDPQGHLQS